MRASEERSKLAAQQVARFCEHLHIEQEKSQMCDRQKKSFELLVKQLQAKIDEADAHALKGNRKIITELEQRIEMLNNEMKRTTRRYQDTLKNCAKQDRKIYDLEFHTNDNKKRFERMHEVIEKLESKAKTQQKQVDEAIKMVEAKSYQQ
ncbi:unnamed protein product [Toxocara canis]|uniref:Uncharacterized protein n=1 Tax=Toxocara canis TaxID=6265 RepID=A0A3P7HF91_TOXCA|nr:unnamed protein product [Toxocara canis]